MNEKESAIVSGFSTASSILGNTFIGRTGYSIPLNVVGEIKILDGLKASPGLLFWRFFDAACILFGPPFRGD